MLGTQFTRESETVVARAADIELVFVGAHSIELGFVVCAPTNKVVLVQRHAILS